MFSSNTNMIITTRNSSYNKVGCELTEPNACGHYPWEIIGWWTKQEHLFNKIGEVQLL